MIEVLILRTREHQFSQITIAGHANSGPYGEDLVCAAVSAIGVGTLNALEKSSNLHVINQEGLIKMTVLHPLNPEERIILETMLIQLNTVHESYSKFIKITERKEQTT